MAGLDPAIHDLNLLGSEDVDARDIGERSDAVLRTAMRGHDDGDGYFTAKRSMDFAVCPNRMARSSAVRMPPGFGLISFAFA